MLRMYTWGYVAMPSYLPWGQKMALKQNLKFKIKCLAKSIFWSNIYTPLSSLCKQKGISTMYFWIWISPSDHPFFLAVSQHHYSKHLCKSRVNRLNIKTCFGRNYRPGIIILGRGAPCPCVRLKVFTSPNVIIKPFWLENCIQRLGLALSDSFDPLL